MPEGYIGLPAYYAQSSDPLTPNYGFSLAGMDPIIAENFVLADTAIAAATTPPPGAPNTSVQFNNGGVFGGKSSFTFSSSLNGVGIGLNSTAGKVGPIAQDTGGITAAPVSSSFLDVEGSYSTPDASSFRTGLTVGLDVNLGADDGTTTFYGNFTNVQTRQGSSHATKNITAILGQADHWGAGSITEVAATSFGAFTESGSGNVNTLVGVVGVAEPFGSAAQTVTNNRACDLNAGNQGLGTIVNNQVMYIHPANVMIVSGTTTNHYGIYIEDQTGGVGVGSAWSIFNVKGQIHSGGNLDLSNTTAATALVSQSSPTLSLSGEYWTGSASAADTWTIQNVVGNGTNGTSELNFTHSGTSGSAWLQVATGMLSPTVFASNFLGLAASFTSTASLGISASSLLVSMGSSWVVRWTNAANWNNTADIGLSRVSAGVLGVGNATQGDISGTISVATAILNGLTSPVEAAPLEIASNASGIGFLIQRTATDYTDFVSGGVVKGIRGGGSTTTPMIVGNANASLTVYSGTGTVFVSGNPATPAGDSTGNLSCFNITEVNANAATSGTSQSSPTHTFSGQYWNGSASATDVWTIQDVIGNGTNGTSTLTLTHSGSTGTAKILSSSGAQFSGLSIGPTSAAAPAASQITLSDTGSALKVQIFSTAGMRMSSDFILSWASSTSVSGAGDTAFTRLGAASLALGNGTANDTTGNLSFNQIIKYNGESTVAPGVAYIRGSTAQRSETGADTNLLTVTPAAATGVYRISVVLSVSAANTATLGWTATWTDSNGNAQAPTNLTLQTAGSATSALTVTAAANATYYGEWYIDINNAGTNIVVKTTFSGTSIAYKASATIERMS